MPFSCALGVASSILHWATAEARCDFPYPEAFLGKSRWLLPKRRWTPKSCASWSNVGRSLEEPEKCPETVPEGLVG